MRRTELMQACGTRGLAAMVFALLLAAPGLAQTETPDAVIELWEETWTLHPDGSSVYHAKQHVRLHNDRAYGEFGDPRITYNTDSQKLEIITARTKLPGGGYRELPDYAHVIVGPDASAGWPAFAGLRQHLLVIGGIEPDCVVELEYKITTAAGAEPFLVGDVRLDHRYPVRVRRATVTSPAGKPVHVALSNAPTEALQGTHCELRDLPAAPDEAQSPPWQTRCPRLVFSTAGLASEWVQARHNQLNAAADSSELITRLAREWTKDQPDDPSRLRALQEKLAAQFNFVEFPVSWRPAALRPASEVLAANYGLPAEAAAVLLALARAVAIPAMPGIVVHDDSFYNNALQDSMVAAYVVLHCSGRASDVRMIDAGDGRHLPVVDMGDYPDMWSPQHGLLTRGARWSRCTLLPVPDVLQPRTQLDAWMKAAESECRVGGKVTIAPDGSFTGELTLRTTGLLAAPDKLRTGDAQKARLQALLGRVVTDAVVESYTVKSLTPDQFDVVAKVKSGKPLKQVDGRYRAQLAGEGPCLADVAVPSAAGQRELPVRLAGAFRETIDLTLAWPEKWQAEVQPQELAPLRADWGTLSQTVTAEKQGVRVQRTTCFERPELTAEEFEAARAGLDRLRTDACRTLLLKADGRTSGAGADKPG